MSEKWCITLLLICLLPLPVLSIKIESYETGGEYYQAGMAQYYSGDYEWAVENLLTANSLDPNNPDYLTGLGIAYAKSRNPYPAIHAFIDSISIRETAEVWCLFGITLEYIGDFSSAKTAYEEALALDPNSEIARERLDHLKSGEKTLPRFRSLMNG